MNVCAFLQVFDLVNKARELLEDLGAVVGAEDGDGGEEEAASDDAEESGEGEVHTIKFETATPVTTEVGLPDLMCAKV